MMKKTIEIVLPLLLLCVTAQLRAQGQGPTAPYQAVVKDKFRTAGAAFEKLDKGTFLEIHRYRNIGGVALLEARVNGQKYFIHPEDQDRLEFQTAGLSPEGYWYLQFMLSSALDRLPNKGWDHEVRRELQEEYLSFQETITLFDDPYLRDYLNQMRLKLVPKPPVPGHPAVFRIQVYESTEPGTFACANGDLFISTGMLAALHSEEELLAVLAQGYAHILFNHAVDNFRRNLSREARAAFWSGMITLAAAVTEAAVVNNEIRSGTFSPVDLYATGAFTESVAFISSSIAFQIADRLGMKYTREQEEEADEAAVALLRNLQLQESALLYAYARIHDAFKRSRSYDMQEADERVYPYIKLQMGALGDNQPTPPDEVASEYIQATAMARRSVAWQSYLAGNYARTQELLTLQLKADAAVLEDYMLQSVLLRETSNEAGDMEEAMRLLRKAEIEAYALSPEIHLEKAMVHLRLDQKEAARQELVQYRNALKKTDTGDENGDRLAWATQMLEKLSRDK